jgi:hypothetical protein
MVAMFGTLVPGALCTHPRESIEAEQRDEDSSQ